jgi:hypothetical protein
MTLGKYRVIGIPALARIRFLNHSEAMRHASRYGYGLHYAIVREYGSAY